MSEKCIKSFDCANGDHSDACPKSKDQTRLFEGKRGKAWTHSDGACSVHAKDYGWFAVELAEALAAERAAREAAEQDCVIKSVKVDELECTLEDEEAAHMESLAMIDRLRTQLAAVTAERDEAREGYHVLDRNWNAHHEACMRVTANALGIQDDSLPAICEAVAARDAELAKLRERLTEYAKTELRRLMEDISEDHYAAGWMTCLSRALWGMVVGERSPKYGMGTVSHRTIARLKELAGDAGGWWTYEEFVPLPQWLEMYESEAANG